MIYDSEPENFHKKIDVVGCYLEYSGKFLLLHRLEHKANGNKLGLPAGKVNHGENLEQAIIREVLEETGIDISENSILFLKSVYVRNEGHDLIFHMFKTTLATPPQISLNPTEHKAYYWLSIDEALSRDDLIHDLDACLKYYYRQ